MLTLISALTYLDRLNLGIAGHYIQSEFALSIQTADRAGWTQALDFAALVTFATTVLWLLVRADQNLEGAP